MAKVKRDFTKHVAGLPKAIHGNPHWPFPADNEVFSSKPLRSDWEPSNSTSAQRCMTYGDLHYLPEEHYGHWDVWRYQFEIMNSLAA